MMHATFLLSALSTATASATQSASATATNTIAVHSRNNRTLAFHKDPLRPINDTSDNVPPQSTLLRTYGREIDGTHNLLVLNIQGWGGTHCQDGTQLGSSFRVKDVNRHGKCHAFDPPVGSLDFGWHMKGYWWEHHEDYGDCKLELWSGSACDGEYFGAATHVNREMGNKEYKHFTCLGDQEGDRGDRIGSIRLMCTKDGWYSENDNLDPGPSAEIGPTPVLPNIMPGEVTIRTVTYPATTRVLGSDETAQVFVLGTKSRMRYIHEAHVATETIMGMQPSGS
ncbi:Hypothetical predicted protein [Lecanosticta acicola]|uniref:Uncharacterized protein n=1 Tax=Lecanosticta acicola TaxID=111012 RepID=A0AAI8Z1I0_9PEZI|nr:Hypothetical predicted protein [Lecanosticta acicola]